MSRLAWSEGTALGVHLVVRTSDTHDWESPLDHVENAADDITDDTDIRVAKDMGKGSNCRWGRVEGFMPHSNNASTARTLKSTLPCKRYTARHERYIKFQWGQKDT